jgi:hypothetical protein
MLVAHLIGHVVQPRVEVLGDGVGATGEGLAARLRLHVAVAVDGPLLLGRTSHKGGGRFRAESARFGRPLS